ncbi:MAG: hypothetical protein DMG22_01195 [Acidobacteria bacterium]|nr:MAG: hypothetical protein DMG22_01195 [Acidobacteriota bacterium]
MLGWALKIVPIFTNSVSEAADGTLDQICEELKTGRGGDLSGTRLNPQPRPQPMSFPPFARLRGVSEVEGRKREPNPKRATWVAAFAGVTAMCLLDGLVAFIWTYSAL